MKNPIEKYLLVKDSSVTEEHNHRTHEIVVKNEIIPITFRYGEDTILPFEHGIKFMKDGFTVEEVDGSTLELPVVPAENVSATLEKDQCVARFSELKTDALKLRAAQKNGGEIYLDATEQDRKEILAFLTGAEPDTIDDEENLIEDTDEDEIFDPSPDRISEIDVENDSVDSQQIDESSSNPNATEISTEQFDTEKYGGTFSEVMNGLLHKFRTSDYVSDPDSNVYTLLSGDVIVAQGTLDDLIAQEVINQPQEQELVG